MGATYSVELINDEVFIGKFVGVVVGTSKANDTLIWETGGRRRSTRYGTIARTLRVEICPACGLRTFRRHAEHDWRCAVCDHWAERPDMHEGRSSYANQRSPR